MKSKPASCSELHVICMLKSHNFLFQCNNVMDLGFNNPFNASVLLTVGIQIDLCLIKSNYDEIIILTADFCHNFKSLKSAKRKFVDT